MSYILCAYEDRAFQEVVSSILFKLFDEIDSSFELLERITAGCNWDNLQSIIEDFSSNSVAVVIGADRGGLQGTDAREKHDLLATNVESRGIPYSVALPQPSVEGWLLTDPPALRDGMAPYSNHNRVRLPAELPPYPVNSEIRAKKILGDLSFHLLGFSPGRGGIEYASEIVQRIDLNRVDEESLKEFLADARRMLGSLV